MVSLEADSPCVWTLFGMEAVVCLAVIFYAMWAHDWTEHKKANLEHYKDKVTRLERELGDD